MPPWLVPSGVRLGGSIFWIFLLGSSMPPCVHFIFLLVVFIVLDSVVNKSNPVWHEMLHLWRTSMACWVVLGKTLLCLIFSSLLSWGCMPYVICSVPLLVLCTICILHVVPTIIGCLDYCEWLLLSLVGLTVCGCKHIIQICGCRMIVGEEFLIAWTNLYWLFPAVIICTSIEGESLYLHFIVPLWSGFWRSELISLYCLICDYLGELTDNCCSWLSLSSLKL